MKLGVRFKNINILPDYFIQILVCEMGNLRLPNKIMGCIHPPLLERWPADKRRNNNVIMSKWRRDGVWHSDDVRTFKFATVGAISMLINRSPCVRDNHKFMFLPIFNTFSSFTHNIKKTQLTL